MLNLFSKGYFDLWWLNSIVYVGNIVGGRGSGLHGLPSSVFKKHEIKQTIVPFLTSVQFSLSGVLTIKAPNKKVLSH